MRARSGEVIISSGTVSKTLSISQESWDGVLVGKTRYELGYDGGTIDLDIDATIPYTLEATAPWIVKDKSSGRRFHIEASDVLAPRQAEILVKGEKGVLIETITILQDEGHTFIAEESVFHVSRDGGLVEIPVNTNIEVTCEIGAGLSEGAECYRITIRQQARFTWGTH